MITNMQSRLLRGLALGDPRVVAGLLAAQPMSADVEDPAVASLVRLGALVALGADVPAYQREVNTALGAGASVDAVIATLQRVAPIVGSNRTMSAAPRLALALGYDVEASLETLEADDP